MSKLYFNTRDDLTAIDVDSIAVVQANGNYSRIVTSYCKEIMLTTGISKVWAVIETVKDSKPKFVKLGRSIIVNHSFLQRIDLLKQVLILSCYGHEIKLSLNKKTLKTYKIAIAESIKIKANGTNTIRNRG